MKIINCKPEPARGYKQDSLKREICSRHMLAFGEDVQQIISSLTIGVIAAGGLGSLIIEQLMRLFPKRLVCIDKDVVELSNINRLVGATRVDGRLGTRKVDLSAENVLKFNPDQKIETIHGDYLDRESQEELKNCDFIFGTSDSNAVRVAGNRNCLAHGIPYLDCGVGAVVEKGQLQAAGGQIIRILPDSGFCLHCADLFDVKESMTEFLSNDEKKRQENQGYIRGAQIAAPQVYSLNMMVAAWAVWLFIRSVSGERLGFDGIAIDAKNFKTYTWSETPAKINDCPTCGKNGIVFAGDEVDLLVKESSESEADMDELELEQAPENGGKTEMHNVAELGLSIPFYTGSIMGEDIGNPFRPRIM